MDTLVKYKEEIINQYLKDLIKFCEILNEKYKENITNFNSIASGTLVTESIFEAVRRGDTIYLTASLPDYWYYVENGRKAGKMPPLSAIMNWIGVKPITPYSVNGHIPTKKGLAYLIARKIGRDGIKGNNLLFNALKSTINEYLTFGKYNIDFTDLLVTGSIQKNVKIIIKLYD